MTTKSVSVSIGGQQEEPRTHPLAEADKLTDWSNEPSVMALNEDFTASKPSHDSMVAKIKEWVDNLRVEGKAKPKVEPNSNRSAVQPKLIRKQGEWRYSALTESFLSSEKLFKVEPHTWEDEEGAQQNELVLNWQMRTKFNRVKFIDEYVRTTFDEGTCFVKVGWMRHTKTVEKQVPIFVYRSPMSEEELMMLQQAAQMREENPRAFLEQADEAMRASLDYSDEMGEAVIAEPTGEFELIEEEEVLVNQPTLDFIDYNNLYIDPSCNGDLNKAKFVIISFETSKADLLADGRYTNLDKVNFSGSTPLSVPDHETTTPDNFNFKDELRKRVVAYEYWGFYDIHGTGELVPIVATWIGSTMIRMEENPFPDGKLPIVAVPYMPLRKSVYGETDAELLADNQKILGAITRGMIDSLARTTNGQRGMSKSMLDITNRRKFDRGEDYEYNPGHDPRTNVIEHKFGEIPQSALSMLELQNMEAESLTGVKAFTGGLSGDAYGKVATAIRGMLDAASKREMGILRRLAEGMTEIGNKIIAMNAVFLSEEEIIRVTNGKYVTVRREDLKGNYDLIVDISTPEIDEAKAQDLNFMLQTNGNNMDHTMRNMILSEIARLKRMPKLAHAIKNYEPQPDPLVERLKELEVQLKEMEVQKIQMEIQELQTKAMLNQAKARETDANADMLDLEFVEQETGTNHARELEKQREQAKGNQNLEVTKALLKDHKKDDKPGDVDAAIGYNRLTNALNI